MSGYGTASCLNLGVLVSVHLYGVVCVLACPQRVMCDARVLARRYVRVLFGYVLDVSIFRAPNL